MNAQAGRFDIDASPLDDIRHLRTLSFVMKDGVIYRNDPSLRRTVASPGRAGR